jgi:acetyl esterase/lipase
MGWIRKTVVAAAVVGAAAAVVPAARRQMGALQEIDPGFRAPMAYIPVSFGPRTTQLMRRQQDSPLADGVALDVRTVPADGAQPPVEVRIYTPADRRSDAGLLWIHGGGYIIGSAAGDDQQASGIAARLGIVVVSVEYRLAPENPFPAAHDDCLHALRWLHANAADLGLDTARIAIGGESAGGGLAAALVLRAVDEGIPVCFQYLIYPMLDDRTVQQAEADGAWHVIWSPASNRYGWASYLGQEPGSPDVSPYAAPARRESLAGLPPAWIGVGSADLFAAEDIDYAARLEAAGVECELLLVPGMFHAAQHFSPGHPPAVEFIRSGEAALARALGTERVAIG